MRKALLKERVDHRVAGAVLEVSGACMGVAAHLALMEMAVILAVVGIAHVVHLIDVLAGALDEVLDGILVAEVVAALYGIEGMRLEAVVRVRDARDAVHATLCHRRGRTRRHELRQHGNLEVLVLRCSERGAHAGTTAADDQNIVCDITLLDFSGMFRPFQVKYDPAARTTPAAAAPLMKVRREISLDIAVPSRLLTSSE